MFALIIILALSTSIALASDDDNEKVAIKISTKTLKVNGEKVIVPKVEGIKDKVLRNLINDNIIKTITAFKNPSAESTLTGTFHTVSNNQSLFIFHFSGSSFTKGTAHPNKIDKGVHLNLKDGKIYTLTDLFKPDIDITMELKKICLANFDNYRGQNPQLNNDWTYKTFIDSWHGDDQNFILYPDHIRIYCIPSFAMGAIAGYNIPYADIMELINTDGDFWKAFQAEKAPAAECIEH